MTGNELLTELEERFLPKMPSVESGWRLFIDTAGQVTLAQVATRLIHLALRQRNRIDRLEEEIAELKKQIADCLKK